MGYLCVGLFVLAIVAGVYTAIEQQRQLAAALKAYQESLERLKSNPNNPEFRQLALQHGRVYSNLTRDKKGVTIYDEVALKNDIDAACAGAVSVHNRSIEDRLANLQKLHSAGHISDEEYLRRRQSILEDV